MMALLANVVLAAVAQETPAITFEAPAVERTITVGLNAAGTVKVDWGNGTLDSKDAIGAYDGWDNALDFTGTPSGTVKIYGEGIIYFQAFTKYAADASEITDGITAVNLDGAATITELDLHQNNLTTVDLSKLTALKTLTIGVNDFETIDLSANTELTKLDMSDGKNNGKVTSVDLSKNTKLTNIVLSGNKLTTLDLSNNPVAKTITVLNNQLTSINLGANTATGHTINLGNNKLTSVDLSQFANTTNSFIYLRDNNLTGDAIKLPANAVVKRLWVDGNAFTLAQLYALKNLATQTFTYATTYTKAQAQAPYELPVKIDVNGTVDLSSQAMLGETATTFVWKNAEGTALVEGTDYELIGEGEFMFTTAQEAIHCEMTNAELNAFTAEKPYKTTEMAVGVDVPAITFEAPAVERTISVGLNAAGTVKVDWGSGTLDSKDAEGAYDGWDNALDFTGTPSGTVKIYGEGIIYFQAFTKYAADASEITDGITAVNLDGAATITELDLHQNNLTTVDLSKLTALKTLTIGVNDFETIDLSANTELTKLDMSDGKNNGKVTSVDLSKNTKLTNIVLSGNKLTTLDLSNNPVAKTITVLNNQLTSINLGANTATGHTINLGNNKLTSVDLSQFANTTNSFIYLRDNNLTGDAIKLPANAVVKRLWVDGNAFTLAQLYALKNLATQTFTYATTYTKAQAQAPYELPVKIDVNGTVDLSSQAMLGETATTFVWKNAEGTALVEGTDYNLMRPGVFTFATTQEAIHCEMTNTELNAFTAEKPYITTTMEVKGSGSGISTIAAEKAKKGEWYNLNGQRVIAPAKGLYIINGKKIAVK